QCCDQLALSCINIDGDGAREAGKTSHSAGVLATPRRSTAVDAGRLTRSETHPLRQRLCRVCRAVSLGSLTALRCRHCGKPVDTDSMAGAVSHAGDVWHRRCFVCAQCFRPFKNGLFYEFDGRMFCEHDFHVLFKPCCAKCGDYIVGPVVRALQASWHPTCFACHRCGRVLADAFVKSLGRALCRECNLEERMQSTVRYLCKRCKDFVDEAELLRYRGDNYHAYHFACTTCRIELTAEAREKDDRLYCIRCFDKLGIPVCARCRRPIDQERVVRALGRAWHVEHFVCAACEKPFNGTRYFERRGLAYCETHFHQLFGQLCFLCGDSISKECVQTCGKSWCRAHFRCTASGGACGGSSTSRTRGCTQSERLVSSVENGPVKLVPLGAAAEAAVGRFPTSAELASVADPAPGLSLRLSAFVTGGGGSRSGGFNLMDPLLANLPTPVGIADAPLVGALAGQSGRGQQGQGQAGGERCTSQRNNRSIAILVSKDSSGASRRRLRTHRPMRRGEIPSATVQFRLQTVHQPICATVAYKLKIAFNDSQSRVATGKTGGAEEQGGPGKEQQGAQPHLSKAET
uniref:Adaptor protein enigma n=1 Tax=Macrostomum lignano TaxID=282301 RepID=A0A1I8IS40_9PLAT